jgi:hypothetical protein
LQVSHALSVSVRLFRVECVCMLSQTSD